VLNPSGLCQCGCGQPAPLAEQSVTARGYVKGEPLRFIKGHHLAQKARRAQKRTWTKRSGPLPTPCWIWHGAVTPDGYTRVWSNGRNIKAHVWMWEQQHGPLPEGLVLDHLCVVSNCVNPEHLEPVTQSENVKRRNARKTTCKHGHPWTAENTYVAHDGRRSCRACMRESQRRYQAKLREERRRFREQDR